MSEQQTIPLVDLRAQFQSIREEVLASIGDVLAGMHLFLGDNVTAFEREFAEYCGVGYCVGVGSGTDALVLALRASGVQPGDEVITVANTFVATVEAIHQVGAMPVLVDVDPDTYTMDPGQIEARISRRTRAIIPVHLYGQMADMPRITDVARRHALVVIEDACQAHGAAIDHRRAGSFGDAACFSFYYSKNLGAYGEAGAVVTNTPEIAADVARLRNHGQTARYQHAVLGVNSRLDELQAAVLRIKLRYLDRWNQQRRSNAARYNQVLPTTRTLVPIERSGAEHVYHLYVIRTDRRAELIDKLSGVGVAAGIHYPVPIHRQPAWAAHGYLPVELPITEKLTSEILSLPMYAELSHAQIDCIGREVGQILGVRQNPLPVQPFGVGWRPGLVPAGSSTPR